MKFLAVVSALLALATAATRAQMGIPPAVVDQARASYIPQPSSFTIAGKEMKFDQPTLERNFDALFTLFEERVKKGGQDTKTPGTALAYCIIAAGEFAQPTPAITDLLEKVRTSVGKTSVPEGVSWPEKAYLGAAGMSFVNEKGVDFDSAGLLQNEKLTYEDLVWAARLKMAIRTTKPSE